MNVLTSGAVSVHCGQSPLLWRVRIAGLCFLLIDALWFSVHYLHLFEKCLEITIGGSVVSLQVFTLRFWLSSAHVPCGPVSGCLFVCQPAYLPACLLSVCVSLKIELCCLHTTLPPPICLEGEEEAGLFCKSLGSNWRYCKHPAKGDHSPKFPGKQNQDKCKM